MALLADADVTVKESCLDPLTLHVTMGRIHPIDTLTGADNMTNAAATISQAHTMAAAVTQFYCSSVGRPINTNEEFSILVEWHDAIEAATAAALSIRSWVDVTDMDKMADECAMWLDHWKEAA